MARHKAISKARWLISQKCIRDIWLQDNILENELDRIRRCYLPLLDRHHLDISKQTRILNLYSGPICAAQLVAGGKKTYLDPLLDEYRRIRPGKLPKGVHLAIGAERIPEVDHSFDIIMCINGLDQALNPELALNEIQRLLKPSGILILGMPILPALIVRMRYFFERFFSPLRDDAHPYSFSLPAFERSLARHFDIVDEIKLDEISITESRWLSSEYAFVCRAKTKTGKTASKSSPGNV